MKLQRGFTLIEVMVVVVIAAILMGAVSMSFPRSGDDLLKEDADRFTALITLMQDEAILQSRDMALAITNTGYEFFSREGSSWDTYEEGPFVPRQLRGNVRSQLYVEGLDVELKTSAKTKPQILIYSSGEMTPLTYVLGNPEGSSVTTKIDAVGTIEQTYKQNDE